MKKITQLMAVGTLSIFLAANSPIVAQSTGEGTTTTRTDDADDDDGDEGRWGLLGLLGLAGLAGLKRRDRDDHRTTNR